MDRKYLGVAAHNTVKVYEIPEPGSGKVINQEGIFEGHNGNITALEFQKDNKWFFTASEDGTLKVFDFKAVGFMRNFDNNGVMINSAVLHPNQGEIYFGDQSGRVRVWDLTENCARELYAEEEEVPISSIAISRDAKKLVAGTNKGTCFIWRSENGEDYEPMQELIAHEGHYVLRCQFSFDGKLLATCSSDKTCAVWELASHIIDQIDRGVTGDDDDDEDFEEYQRNGLLSGHGGWVWDCDITCDNRTVITVSTDQKVRIWRNGKEEIRRVLEGHTKGVTCLAFRDAPILK